MAASLGHGSGCARTWEFGQSWRPSDTSGDDGSSHRSSPKSAGEPAFFSHQLRIFAVEPPGWYHSNRARRSLSFLGELRTCDNDWAGDSCEGVLRWRPRPQSEAVPKKN